MISKNKIIGIFLFFFLFSGCGPSENQNGSKGSVEIESVSDSGMTDVEILLQDCEPPVADTEMIVHGVAVTILASPDAKASILLLPGWNFTRTDWCAKSSFCDSASAAGFRLILPEMGKSVYTSEYFPESRADWRKFPTRTWVRDTLIPLLQDSLCLLLPGQQNFIAGLSTGARGAALLALDMPEVFRAGAGLSGDYEQRAMPNDNLMKGTYGSIQKFPERWSGKDNPAARAAEWKVPFYLAHGIEDPVVPAAQTQILFDSLSKYMKDTDLQLNMTEGKHDYEFWGSQTMPMLEFFRNHMNTK